MLRFKPMSRLDPKRTKLSNCAGKGFGFFADKTGLSFNPLNPTPVIAMS